jgi:hypothetical protein
VLRAERFDAVEKLCIRCGLFDDKGFARAHWRSGLGPSSPGGYGGVYALEVHVGAGDHGARVLVVRDGDADPRLAGLGEGVVPS